MIAGLALLALQTRVLSLDAPGDDDGPVASIFSADGGSLLVGHAGGTVTRIDLAAGAAVRSVPLGVSLTTWSGMSPVPPGDAWVLQVVHHDVAPGGAATVDTSTAVRLRFR